MESTALMDRQGDASIQARDKQSEGSDRADTKRNKELGRRGEEAAARYLACRGYDILEKNWNCRAGEADLIAKDEDAIVFIEVKTRTNLDKGMPEDAVSAKKRQKYERIAAMYLSAHDVGECRIRFDVVALLVIAPDRVLVRHHIDAFSRED